ncbi:MAG TPA: glycosyltransferase family 2 protein [Nitrospirales bacterium]|nr:glycosyltransferase family 2 protein [Nitrospirales bacterium]HIA14429.1 glycosyltransferase family 2 protein [Nitrospirales bacterium]HIB54782.1 glycosyltransferase family 2 protein [Nitrospirales bacterium]HIC04326.1 glycosyltransferase family 2 protein [Nitrospirales bacterium]HIN33059.1 glycosyltransferase family 2 protein [Nitrospirales bacterium]
MTQSCTQGQRESSSPPLASSLIFVIPAYNPTGELIQIIQNLSQQTPQNQIVVVDDGSSGPSKNIVQEVQRHPAVRLVRHETHCGKGQALKTAIEHIREHYPSCTHIVTADADGQHAVHDILSVAHDAQTWREHLVLGSREFNNNVPIRSWIGNTIIRVLFRVCTGLDLRDTQTGLRGIPIGFGLQCLAFPSTGYDFEMAMLIECKTLNMAIREMPIQTIYNEGNRYSHFNPLIDSLKICRVIVRSAFLSCKRVLRQALEALLPRFMLPLIVSPTSGVRNTILRTRAVTVKNVRKDGG